MRPADWRSIIGPVVALMSPHYPRSPIDGRADSETSGPGCGCLRDHTYGFVGQSAAGFVGQTKLGRPSRASGDAFGGRHLFPMRASERDNQLNYIKMCAHAPTRGRLIQRLNRRYCLQAHVSRRARRRMATCGLKCVDNSNTTTTCFATKHGTGSRRSMSSRWRELRGSGLIWKMRARYGQHIQACIQQTSPRSEAKRAGSAC